MSRPLSQLLPPDLPPAGASPQFGSSGQAGASLGGGHLNSVANLKSLLQLPMKSDQRFKDSCEMKDKDRLDLDEDSLSRCSMRSGGNVALGDGSNGGGGSGGFSNNAFLGPLLWERTLPCDGGLFQLQYMDLEEFLTENGMGSMHSNTSCPSAGQIPSQSSQSAMPSQSSQCPPTSPAPCSSSSSSSSSSVSASSSPTLLGLDMPATQSMMGGASDCLRGSQTVTMDTTQSPSSSSSCPPLPTSSPTANGADLMANFDPEAADLALSSVPGQDAFDPRRHRFSDEELKPQPMIKKARKTLVPDNLKDEKYWSRRHKNNEAAKRSRDARRLKENQISVRAAFLERENAALRQEVADMRKELGRCRNILNKYESRQGNQ
ncbi:D site albumin promoter binding protein b isoform X2 [Chanos chanos]|uniref:D site albumin promoter binding protein b isoform X2 n=1 Tax=Chanos chanos TaxID=29144 RepID=A0A6J2W527_CHACN|nr:thyrotroph embryonic factor-like isoform X2 [Chanos chanos]